MREILFRGKQEHKNKEWVFGNLHCEYGETDKNGRRKIDYRILGMRGECDYVLSETVGQFTGLTDKNGKKIFEGDVVVCRQEINGNWIDYCVEIGYVEMKHGAFGLHRKQGYYRPFKDWLEDYEYEVIGNIHDNPELLEE